MFLREIMQPYSEGIYFDEFMQLAFSVSSDLFFCIYDAIYKCVPCVQNFLLMRQNFKKFLQQNLGIEP